MISRCTMNLFLSLHEILCFGSGRRLEGKERIEEVVAHVGFILHIYRGNNVLEFWAGWMDKLTRGFESMLMIAHSWYILEMGLQFFGYWI